MHVILNYIIYNKDNYFKCSSIDEPISDGSRSKLSQIVAAISPIVSRRGSLPLSLKALEYKISGTFSLV